LAPAPHQSLAGSPSRSPHCDSRDAGQTPRTRDVAIDAVERDGGDGKHDGNQIRRNRVVETSEKRDGGKSDDEPCKSNSVGRHVSSSQNFWTRYRNDSYWSLAAPASGLLSSAKARQSPRATAISLNVFSELPRRG
jgi:hypothetical protein